MHLVEQLYSFEGKERKGKARQGKARRSSFDINLMRSQVWSKWSKCRRGSYPLWLPFLRSSEYNARPLHCCACKKSKEKTTPFGVHSMRRQISYRAAQACISWSNWSKCRWVSYLLHLMLYFKSLEYWGTIQYLLGCRRISRACLPVPVDSARSVSKLGVHPLWLPFLRSSDTILDPCVAGLQHRINSECNTDTVSCGQCPAWEWEKKRETTPFGINSMITHV